MQKLAENLKDESGSLDAVKCDLTKEDEILSMFSHIKKTYGAVDVCVNNAGLAIVAPLLSGETSAWKNVFDVGIDLDMIARVCVYVKYTKLQTCMQVRDLRFSLCRF